MASPCPQVAFFLPSLTGGGAERVSVTLMNAMVAQGVRVELVLVSASGPYLADLDDRVQLVALGGGRALAALPRLCAYLRRARPGALVSALDYANVLAIAAGLLSRTTTRIFVVEHNSLVTGRRAGAKLRVKRALMRWLYPRAAGVIAVSADMARQLVDQIGTARERTHVLYNPIDCATIAHAANGPPDHPWLAETGVPVILSAGRLTAQKDYANLLMAFARVRQTRTCRLIILGEGELQAELEALARQLGVARDVDFPGFIANPYPWFRAAAVFVLSSQWEGLPTVLIEAMACGTPVVSTDCPTGPAEILVGSAARNLVPPEDPIALAEALDRVLAAGAGSASAGDLDRFSPDRVARNYLDILRPRSDGVNA